ncbi:hypothetical protein TVAG_267110 [Trichomonas vaginalis G3]|uniref:Uncharacterized protein n=2 Tax=Trichomonas vaginalis (strain ATCC PRA-98 / G3) TaxID=412133 RepID=A2F549_TRIV3|nr:hypothetical protein TVAG_267110 [Trichomonas vaginalis G3]|eukprot:XP_001312872.1 hypothetical protein [Trichomonas vaginalis G3]
MEPEQNQGNPNGDAQAKSDKNHQKPPQNVKKQKNQKETNQNPEEKQEKRFQVNELVELGPEDSIKRSLYGMKRDNVPYINYSRYCEDIKDKISQVQMLEQPEFKTIDFKEYIKVIMPYLDATPEDEILANPDHDFVNYIKEISKLIPTEFYGPLQKFWHPVYTVTSSKDHDFAYFMAKFLRASADPTKLARILAKVVFKDTIKNKSSTSRIVRAMSACTFEKKKATKWAIINQDSQFYLIGVKDKELVVQAEGLVKEVIRTKTGDGISVIGLNGKPICKNLVLKDPQHILSWIRCMNDPIPFYNFMSSIIEPYPDQVYQAIYAAVTHSDFVYVRTLFELVPPDHQQSLILMRSLFNIFCYAGKINQFYQLVVLKFFESNPDITAPYHLKNLVNVVFMKSCGNYMNFMKTLVKYIDDSNVNVDDKSSIDKSVVLLTTVIKIISQSYIYVSPELHHLLSIVKEVASLHHNNLGSLYDLISELFLLGPVSDMILNPEAILKVQVAHKEIFKPLILQLRKVFRLGLLDRHLSDINDRLEKHTYDKLFEFIMYISDFDYEILPDYTEGMTEISRLARDIDVIFVAITKLGAHFSKALIRTDREPYSPCGYNFIVLLSRFFVHWNDPEVLRARNTKLLPAEAVIDRDGTVRRIVPITPDMELKPGVKMYKKIKRPDNILINDVVKPNDGSPRKGSPRILKKIKNADSEKKPGYVIKVEKSDKKIDTRQRVIATEV